MKLSLVASTALAGAALASPTPTGPEKRQATTVCGQWDSVPTGSYTVYQNLWGMDQASSGSQCTSVDSLSGSTLSWSTSWSWQGGAGQVKSFANTGLNFDARQLSSISSIPATWSWRWV